MKEPEKGVAPRAFPKTAEGTDCIYRSKAGRGSVVFRIYFDASPTESADLFKRLKMYFGGGTEVAGGNEAYFDKKHALHERKGNARFFLESNGMDKPPAETEKQLSSLAAAVAARL